MSETQQPNEQTTSQTEEQKTQKDVDMTPIEAAAAPAAIPPQEEKRVPLESRAIPVSEQADEQESAIPPEVLALPIEERLSHKELRVRIQAANEYLNSSTTELSTNSLSLLRKMVSESQPAAQETALQALIKALASTNNEPVSQEVLESLSPNTLCDTLCEKSLCGRPKPRGLATDLVLLLIEADQSAIISESLLKGTNHKTPKVVSGAICALKTALSSFGPEQFPVKEAVKSIGKWFSNRDKDVRKEASEFMIELCRWIGKDAMQSYTKDLKPALVKELESGFEQLPPPPKAVTRQTRSRKAALAKNSTTTTTGNTKGGSKGKGVIPPPMSALDALVDPVNILGKIKGSFYETLESGKWQEKRDELQGLIDNAKVPVLEQGDYNALVSALKKTFADSNLVVKSKGVETFGVLAKGLRAGFRTHGRNVIPLMLQLFKEKKPTFVATVQSALNSITDYSVCFVDAMEDIQEACSSKVPTVPHQTLIFLTRAITEGKTNYSQAMEKSVKQISIMLCKLAEHENVEVRTQAIACIGAFQDAIGEDKVSEFLSGLDPKKLEKIHKPHSDAPSPTKTAASSSDSDLPTTHQKAPPQQQQVQDTKKATKQKEKPIAKGKQQQQQQQQSAPQIEDEALPSSKEEALKRASEMLPQEALGKIGDKQWKERQQGMEELLSALTAQMPSGAAWNVLNQLEEKPGFKENNVMVAGKILEVVGLIAEQEVAQFGRACAALAIDGLISIKLGDLKLHTAAGECLTKIVVAVGLPFVIHKLYTAISNQRNPKCAVEALSWTATAIEEFGIAGIQADALITHLKVYLDNPAPAVKTAAVKALTIVRRYLGPQVRSMLEDVKKQLLEQIDKAFEEVASLPQPQPTKKSRAGQSAGSTSRSSVATPELPRADLAAKLSKNVLADLENSAWKTRQEAVAEIQRILKSECNSRIEVNLGSIATALKGRLADSNKGVVRATMTLISEIASAMGKPHFDKHIKTLLPPLLQMLGDTTKAIRDEASQCCSVMADNSSLAVVLSCLVTALSSDKDSVTLRRELAAFLDVQLAKLDIEQESTALQEILVTLVKPVLGCMQDRQVEVRRFGEKAAERLVQRVGIAIFDKTCGEFKPAVHVTLQQSLAKFHTENKTTEQQSTPTPSQTQEQSTEPQSETAQKKSATSAVTTAATSVPSGKKQPLMDDGKRSERAKNLANQEPSVLATPAGRQWLRDVIRHCVGDMALLSAMFSPDSTKEAKACNEIKELVTTHSSVAVECSDILTCWAVSAILSFPNDGNLINAAAELIKTIVKNLKEKDGRMLDYEASAIVAAMAKLGARDPAWRRSVIADISSVYPSSKLLSRAQKELTTLVGDDCACILLLATFIIEKHGLQSTDKAATVSTLARYAQSENSSIKSEALSALRAAQQHIGEDLWKHVPMAIAADVRKAIEAKEQESSQAQSFTEASLNTLALSILSSIQTNDFKTATRSLKSLSSLLGMALPPTTPVSVDNLVSAIAATARALTTATAGQPDFGNSGASAISAFNDCLKRGFFSVEKLPETIVIDIIQALVRGFAAGNTALHRAFIGALKNLPPVASVIALLRELRSEPESDKLHEACMKSLIETISLLDTEINKNGTTQVIPKILPEIRAVIECYSSDGKPHPATKVSVGVLNFLFTRDSSTVISESEKIENEKQPILGKWINVFSPRPISQMKSQQQQQQQTEDNQPKQNESPSIQPNQAVVPPTTTATTATLTVNLLRERLQCMQRGESVTNSNPITQLQIPSQPQPPTIDTTDQITPSTNQVPAQSNPITNTATTVAPSNASAERIDLLRDRLKSILQGKKSTPQQQP